MYVVAIKIQKKIDFVLFDELSSASVIHGVWAYYIGAYTKVDIRLQIGNSGDYRPRCRGT